MHALLASSEWWDKYSASPAPMEPYYTVLLHLKSDLCTDLPGGGFADLPFGPRLTGMGAWRGWRLPPLVDETSCSAGMVAWGSDL